jgi:hypothetical protein
MRKLNWKEWDVENWINIVDDRFLLLRFTVLFLIKCAFSGNKNAKLVAAAVRGVWLFQRTFAMTHVVA